MKNAKIQKRALFTSLLALLLCCTMLVGTTFAWFTDSVESGINKIAAGNLDIEAYYKDGSDWKNLNDAGDYDLFEDTLWEPGKVQYANLKVVNEGTLALNYALSVNFMNENTVLEVDADGNATVATTYKLSDVIKVAFIEDGIDETKLTGTEEENRVAVIKMAEAAGLNSIKSMESVGELEPSTTAASAEKLYGVVLYWEPNDNDIDNRYNLNNGKKATKIEGVDGSEDKLMITLGIKLEATQLTYETDSFGPNYDSNAIECDILATPETIDDILSSVTEGTVIGLAAGKYGSITLTQNNLTLITNTAVVDYVNANAKDNCKLIGITFDAAGAQMVYGAKGAQDLYTNITGAKTDSNGADYLEIIDCTFTGTPAVDVNKYIPIAFYERARTSGSMKGFSVDGCTFETNASYYIYAYYPGHQTKGTIEITDNTFGTANTSVGTAVYLGNTQAHTIVRNNTFVNSSVIVTPHNNAGCTYALNVEVSYNHFINTSDTAATAIALRHFHDLPKCTTTVKENTANYGKSTIADPYVDNSSYKRYDVTPSPADFKMASNAAELTSAIESATEDITIMLMSDITATVTAKQNADVDVVIDGQGYECSETIYLHGQARHTGAETLTFKNINFVADSEMDFISANSTESDERYAHNVTVENCTFKATGTGDVVGLRLRQTYNITVKNCTADGLHSLLWATGGNGITVDNVTVTNSKHGVSFGTSNNVVVKNCNFTATDAYGYGIRVDASGAYSLSVENSTIKAAAPILLRKATGAYAAILSGNTLTTTDTYQIIVTAGDFEEGTALTAPTGSYTLSGADGLTVYKG